MWLMLCPRVLMSRASHDKAGKFHRRRFTPLTFLKSVKTFEPLAACSLVNDPRRGYNKLMSVDRLQNVWGARPVSYVNTTSQVLKGRWRTGRAAPHHLTRLQTAS